MVYAHPPMAQIFDPDAPATQRDIKWLAEMFMENRTMLEKHGNTLVDHSQKFELLDNRLATIETTLVDLVSHNNRVLDRLEKHDHRITALEVAYQK